MTEPASAIIAAVWLGILTSISPCPLATNIAAVSFIGRKLGHPGYVLASGILYTAGRMAVYVLLGALAVYGLMNVPLVSHLLQRHMNAVVGPVLLLAALFMLGLVRIRVFEGRGGLAAQRFAEKTGLWGAFLLGSAFAMALCPVSAALFLGGLVPLAAHQGSPVFLPLVFGIGTGLPVLGFALLIFLGAGAVARGFRIVDGAEKWARYLTGGVFAAIGVHLSLLGYFSVNVLEMFR